jgi:septum formation inhibitor MinC
VTETLVKVTEEIEEVVEVLVANDATTEEIKIAVDEIIADATEVISSDVSVTALETFVETITEVADLVEVVNNEELPVPLTTDEVEAQIEATITEAVTELEVATDPVATQDVTTATAVIEETYTV